MEQLRTIGRELAMGSQGGWGQSKEFLDLVKSIGEARSKAEEDRIIARELEHLKRRLADPDVPRRKMKELLLRLVYAEMLGHDASFCHIHAVNMTHDESIPLKRSGYLAVALFLDERHDLRSTPSRRTSGATPSRRTSGYLLVVNTIQKDLRSDNYLVVCVALTAACRLIGEEAIPAVLAQVVGLADGADGAVCAGEGNRTGGAWRGGGGIVTVYTIVLIVSRDGVGCGLWQLARKKNL
jgi:AP-4 complex subunit epsilon-1